jgi:hypothetical protein
MPDGLAVRILEWAKRMLDESVSAERLRAFLAESLVQANAGAASGRILLSEAAQRDLDRARLLAGRLDILPPAPGAQPLGQDGAPGFEQSSAWPISLGERKVIGRSGLVPGAGPALIALLERPPQEGTLDLDAILESLLRHVETRRKAGLRLAPPLEGQDPWMEWLAIAILFARAAHRGGDLRFLNAALKINDWAYPSHRHARLGPRLARYLLSVAEQETALGEALH